MRTAPPNEAARPRAQAKATLTSERARRALLLGVWDPSTGTVRILPTFPRDIPPAEYEMLYWTETGRSDTVGLTELSLH